MNERVRIIILNFNGIKLLPECLPSIVDAARISKRQTAVTLLDNHSTDQGLEYARLRFPDVEIVVSKGNRFLCSYNDYLPTITDEVVILLNNDIRVDPQFIDPLIAPFERDPKMFLVAPRVMNFEGTKVEAARAKSGVRFGFFWCDARYPGFEKEFMIPSVTVSSGFGAFSRKIFLELGGYDDRYLPGIMEDVDLCLSAKTKGYRLLYEPSSIVYHMGQASFKEAFGSFAIKKMGYRNSFLFMWKHFKGWMWVYHMLFLPFRLLWSLMKGNKAMLSGFYEAMGMRKTT